MTCTNAQSVVWLTRVDMTSSSSSCMLLVNSNLCRLEGGRQADMPSRWVDTLVKIWRVNHCALSSHIHICPQAWVAGNEYTSADLSTSHSTHVSSMSCTTPYFDPDGVLYQHCTLLSSVVWDGREAVGMNTCS